MSTYTTTLRFSNGDLTLFKAWGQGIGTILAATGWTKTSDTGQIDWAGLAAVPAINTSAGYEIYRKTNDTLDSTAPIYLKVEFAASSSISISILRISIGTGTDGAGTLTGLVSTVRYHTVGAAQTVAAEVSVCYGDGFYTFAWTMASSASGGNCVFFAIDRSRDATGAATADMVTIYDRYQNQVGQQTLQLSTPAQVYPLVASWMGIAPPTVTVWSTGSDTLTSPIYPLAGNIQNPTVSFITGFHNDFLTAGSVFQAELYGENRYWKILPANFYGTVGGNTSLKALMRWE